MDVWWFDYWMDGVTVGFLTELQWGRSTDIEPLAYFRTRQDQRPTDPIHPLHVFLHIYDMRGQEMGWAWHAYN